MPQILEACPTLLRRSGRAERAVPDQLSGAAGARVPGACKIFPWASLYGFRPADDLAQEARHPVSSMDRRRVLRALLMVVHIRRVHHVLRLPGSDAGGPFGTRGGA